MTREEEIKIASTDYVRLSNRICPDEKSFFDGAEWADEHPKNVWHNASEEPKKGELILIEIVLSIPEKNEVKYFVEYAEIWLKGLMKFRRLYGFQYRWAYISDLLPKESRQ